MFMIMRAQIPLALSAKPFGNYEYPLAISVNCEDCLLLRNAIAKHHLTVPLRFVKCSPVTKAPNNMDRKDLAQ
nr:unnamed protein product [Callosobruchus analis]